MRRGAAAGSAEGEEGHGREATHGRVDDGSKCTLCGAKTISSSFYCEGACVFVVGGWVGEVVGRGGRVLFYRLPRLNPTLVCYVIYAAAVYMCPAPMSPAQRLCRGSRC